MFDLLNELRLKRRDFLKLSAVTALLASLDWTRVVRAFSEAVKKNDIGIVWFEAQSCTGDTDSLLEASDPSILDVLLGTTPLVPPGAVSLWYSDAVRPEWGVAHIEKLEDAEKVETYSTKFPGNAVSRLYEYATSPKYAGKYVLILEGSLPVEYGMKGSNVAEEGGFHCKVGPFTCTEWFKMLMKNAAAIIAVGNCACYGGIPANKVIEPPPGFTYPGDGWSKSPTGSIGVFDDPFRGIKGVIHNPYFEDVAKPYRAYFDEDAEPDFKTAKPVIAVPGCPAGPNAIVRVAALVALVALGKLPPSILRRSAFLDEYGRPKFIFGRTVHEQCPRAGFYAASDFRERPGDNDARCLFAVGCKGPIANCPWNKVGWVAGIGGPVRQGGVCIACTMPGFTDSYEPFYVALPTPRLPPIETSVGALAAGIVIGAIGAYIAARAAKPRR